ncbi:hypothetical protein [Hydrogenobaculum acidophilum]
MKKQSGYTLITTMLVMIILFVIGIAGALLVYYGNMTSTAMINYQKAYYNADYGLQQAAYNAMNGICNCQNNGCGMSQNLPTGGTVTVITQADTNNTTCFIESIGKGQTGGQVAKAVAISTGGSNWGALGILNGAIMNFFGSAAINGCDYTDNCQAAGLLRGNGLSIVLGLNYYTCQSNPNSNNPQGIIGNPAVKTISAPDIAKMITNYPSFSALQQAIQDMACPPDGSSCLNIPNPASLPSNCVCYGSAVSNDGQTIQCNSITTLSSSCSSYYIAGVFNANNGFTLNNQNLYAVGGINIDGPFNLSNATVVSDAATNMNSTINATNSNIYVSTGSIAFDSTSILSGTKVYDGMGDIYFNGANGQNITADLCGGNPCNSSNDSIVYTNGATFVNGPIQGGLLYGNGGLTIQGINGNREVGTSQEPVVAISGIGSNSNMTIDMSGTTQFNGLIMAYMLGNFNIGNNQINGALYANDLANFNVGGNASINFNYNILSQIVNDFPNIFQPVNCYSQGTQESLLNASTLY